MRKIQTFKYILYLQRNELNPHITVIYGNMGINFSLKQCTRIITKSICVQQKIIKKLNLKGRYQPMGKMGKIIGTLAIAVVTAVVKNILDD